jgi:hypothetical protein
MTGSAGAWAAARRHWIALIATAVVVEAVYVFLVSAGHWTHWPVYNTYVSDLADGFLHGHLHLATEPPAALVARPNPLDPANSGLWYWDASLYGSHYYLYWGPVPALLLAFGKGLFRVRSVVGDQVALFWMATIQLVALTWLVGRAARTLFDEPPLLLQVLALVVAALANPTPYNFGRSAVYEASIVGGHAFLLLGIALAFEAIARPATHRRWLVLAGAAWALALGSRISIAPALGVLVVLVGLRWMGGANRQGLRRGAEALVCAGVPLALGLGLLLLYNRLRFNEWLEFGWRYQMTWIRAPASARYAFANLYTAMLRPPVISCRFPYVFAPMDMGAVRAFPGWYHPPDGYFVYEQVVGFLNAIPLSWAAPVGWVAGARDLWQGRNPNRAWAVAMATTAALVTMSANLVLASTTNRYLGDGCGGVALTGAFGVWIGYAALRDRPVGRRVVAAGALGLGFLSVLAGLALGFIGPYGHFPSQNAQLSEKLVQGLSVCHGPLHPYPK